MSEAALLGVEPASVVDWLLHNIAGLQPPVEFTNIPGGHSNLTYLVTDRKRQRFVLRRPPLGELLPGAHDMSREFRAISALGPTGVPVPQALGFCDDHDVTGASFYVMSFVEGHVLHNEQVATAVYSPESRHRVGLSLTEALDALHSVDIDVVGVGNLGRREDYVGRQLRRWFRQYDASRAMSVPLVDELYESLLLARPEQQKASLVHGDYRLGNCITDDNGEIAAILDWEICTLGDPLADVGYMLVTWAEPGDEHQGISMAPSMAPGFATKDELLERYASASDLDLSPVRFYIAFNHWKSACINEGVYARYVKGQKPADGVDVDAIGAAVEVQARLAAQVLQS
ncbi:MAG: phosphotransferase family protein [Acidimicrobiia bacterium]|nr:phosphotransferase family protein [Acidimicrobiia bacterium]